MSTTVRLQLQQLSINGLQDKNVLLFAFGVFVLVFGVLMAVYRHHLIEISKCQYFRIAFMRIEAATDESLSGKNNSLLKASLVNRAFDYRSGKEKTVESPLPGHPAFDASTEVVNKLLEVIESKSKA